MGESREIVPIYLEMRRFSPLILSLVLGCAGAQNDDGPAPWTGFLIQGSDMSVLSQSLDVTNAQGPVSNALVTVNGTVIPEIQFGHYAGQLPAPLSVGDSVTLIVAKNGYTVVGTTTVPTVPTLVAPVGGTAIQIPVPLDFAWADTNNPDSYRIAIQYNNGLAEFAGYGGSARSGLVVTSRLPSSATNLSASIAAYNDGTFSATAAQGSRMRFRQPGLSVSLVMSH